MKDQIKKEIQKIIKLLKTKENSFNENLLKDLESIIIALDLDIYRRHVLTEQLRRLGKTNQEFINLIYYYQEGGKYWKKIFDLIAIKDKKTILDLLPGWAPKIAYGLIMSKYKGEYFALDKNKKFLSDLKTSAEFLLPKFKITKLHQNFLRSDSGLKADVVIANHIIDDLIMNIFFQDSEDIYKNETIYNKNWQWVLNNKNECETRLISELISKIDSFVADGGFLILNQYEGCIEKMFQQKKGAQFCIKLMHNLKEQLISDYNYIQEPRGNKIDKDTVILKK